jgi:hypothetical protein
MVALCACPSSADRGFGQQQSNHKSALIAGNCEGQSDPATNL